MQAQTAYTADSGLKFSAHVFKLAGLNPAIVYENIRFWVDVNTRNKTTTKNGYTWTYQSIREMAEQIAFMTQKQVRKALEKLEEYGLIKTNFFGGCDRRKWYTIEAQTTAKQPSEAEAPPTPEKQPKQATAPAVAHLPKEDNPFTRSGKCLQIHTQIQKQLVSKPAPLTRDELLTYAFMFSIVDQFTDHQLTEHADDYLTFCQKNRYQPSKDGFITRKLPAKLAQMAISERKREALEKLIEQKQRKQTGTTGYNIAKDENGNHTDRTWAAGPVLDFEDEAAA